MSRIFDNLSPGANLASALQETLAISNRADFCVGYFNLRGWGDLAPYVDRWNLEEGPCRVLIGMMDSNEEPKDALGLHDSPPSMDNTTVHRQWAEQFLRQQLASGLPNTDEEGLHCLIEQLNQAALHRLIEQLKAKRVIVKLFLRHQLHAKLYLLFRDDPNNPITGYLGSSNLTFAGLSQQGELNVDVLDHDTTGKLRQWFEDRWNDCYCIDITEELLEVIKGSGVRPDLLERGDIPEPDQALLARGDTPFGTEEDIPFNEEDRYGSPSETDYGAYATEDLASGGERALARHATVRGTVEAVHPDYIQVRVDGAPHEGRILEREQHKLDPALRRELQTPGFQHDFHVQHTPPRARPGAGSYGAATPFYELTISGLWSEADWATALDALQSGAPLTAVPVNYNKGGLIVRLGQTLEGFVPNSHLWNTPREATQREQALRTLVEAGRPLPVKVIEASQANRKLVLSNTKAEREQRKRKDAILEELEVGEVRAGVVSSLADFGAFVNIGGADGLIHVSELSWSMVNHPSEVLNVGQKVEVKVISVEKERKRIGLSLRQLQPRPWDTLAERYREGDLVRAVITRIKNFGAFAQLVGEPVEGLIHISEMSHEHVEQSKQAVEQVVTVGEEYEVKIIRLDIQRRRMGLSIKQADLDWDLAPDAAAEEAPTAVTASGDSEKTVATPAESPRS